MALYLGIDSGTQSTKALVVDESGAVLGRGAAACAMIEGLPPGHKEQHPADWIAAMQAAIVEALGESNRPGSDVAAIGVSGQQHGFVALDKNDAVIRPAKLWCDTSTEAEARALADTLRASGDFEAIGNSLPPGFTAPKILWLKNHEPDNFRRLARVLLPHDYLNWWLTGEATMEHGDASGSGLMDIRQREWNAGAIAAIDERLRACLPALRSSAEPAGVLRAEAASALGLRAGIPVSAGGGDNMMGAIGTGNVAPGVVTVSLGTSGTIYACSGAPVIDPQGEIAAFCDSTGQWLPLLCTMNVTVATELVRHQFDMTTEQLNRAAQSVAPGADGLMLLPYFEGERVPNVSDGTGVWIGVRAATANAAHHARAAMEGATLGLGYGLNRMRELGLHASEIRLTGGGSKSDVWRQICADVFATPVVCTTEPEGAALGAAAQACWMHRKQADPRATIKAITDAWIRLDEATRCTPQPAAVAIYKRLQRVHDDASRALRPIFPLHRQLVS